MSPRRRAPQRPAAPAGAARSARCSSGWRWRGACRPRRTCARARGRSRAATAWTWMSSSTQSVGTSFTRRNVLSRLLPPPWMPSAWPMPIGTKSPSTASAAPSTPSRTSGMRAHSTVRPSPRVPSRSSRSRPLATRWSSAAVDGVAGVHAVDAVRALVGRRHVRRHRLPLPLVGELAVAEGGVDGEDLAVGDVAHGAGLRHLVPLDGERDVDVDELAGAGEREVLGGRPDRLPPARALHRGDRGAEPGAAEHEVAARADARPSPGASSGTGCGSAPGRGTCGCPSAGDRRHESGVDRGVAPTPPPPEAPASPVGGARDYVPGDGGRAMAGRCLLARRRLPAR